MATDRMLEMQRKRRDLNKKKRRNWKIKRMRNTRKAKGLDQKKGIKYASKFEETVHKNLRERGCLALYESTSIEYKKIHSYTPDFELPNGIYIETKGRFVGQDRSKHLLIKSQQPHLDIRFVFMRNLTLNKKSKTRYTDWCDKYGFKWAIKLVPQEWLDEPMRTVRT